MCSVSGLAPGFPKCLLGADTALNTMENIINIINRMPNGAGVASEQTEQSTDRKKMRSVKWIKKLYHRVICVQYHRLVCDSARKDSHFGLVCLHNTIYREAFCFLHSTVSCGYCGFRERKKIGLIGLTLWGNQLLLNWM